MPKLTEEERKKKHREYSKKYRANKPKIKEINKKYRSENKIKLQEINKKYRSENKEKISENKRKYYQKHKIKIKENTRKYKNKIKEKKIIFYILVLLKKINSKIKKIVMPDYEINNFVATYKIKKNEINNNQKRKI